MMELTLPNERMSFSGCLTIFVLTAGLVLSGGHSGFAVSYCSNSFRFDQLCPDPRTGPQNLGTGSQLPSDTSVNLNLPSSGPYRHGGGGMGSYPSSSYGASSYSSSASFKDASTNGCDFHRNGVETDVITAIQVTENPWNFRHAAPCNQFLKFSYAHKLTSGGSLSETTSSGGGGSKLGAKGVLVSKDHICQNEIGIRRQGSRGVEEDAMDKKQPLHQEEANQISEEIARKTNVYFWHNFTIYSHSADFVDTITNYHWSREDIACANERNGRYVQIAVVVSKRGKCEILVQQYKINEGRSPYGCPLGDNPIPHQFPFCGSYDCSQINSILTSLKLLTRRDLDPYENTNQNSNWKKGGADPLNKEGKEVFLQKHNYDDGSHYKPTGDLRKSTEGPCVTDTVEITTPSSFVYVKDGGEEEEEEEPAKPTDIVELTFLVSFPVGGVIFIIVVLFILRSKSGRYKKPIPIILPQKPYLYWLHLDNLNDAEKYVPNSREICHGYPYPQQRHHHHSRHSMYHQGSFGSIDKNDLPI